MDYSVQTPPVSFAGRPARRLWVWPLVGAVLLALVGLWVRGRVESEVQLTSQLTHPNTIAIYDYGRTPEGVFYYAMEYLEGISLDELVKRHGPQSEGRVIHLLLQVCHSLAEAHAVGLVHRDIKPANIFLTRRGGVPDFVKVLDFGLVKAPVPAGTLAGPAEQDIMGTPLYLSPEAIEQPATVDARSDLYSVGAVGYYLLTGHPLFEGGGIEDILRHQVRTTPPIPSAVLGRTISADLELLVMRCLAKAPAERLPSATALAEALGRCRESSAWTELEALAWWNKHYPPVLERTTVLSPRQAALSVNPKSHPNTPEIRTRADVL